MIDWSRIGKVFLEDIGMSACNDDDEGMEDNPSLNQSKILDYFPPKMWCWKQFLNEGQTVQTVNFIHNLLA